MGGRGGLRKVGGGIGGGASLAISLGTTRTPRVARRSTALPDDAHPHGKIDREFGLKLPHVFRGLKDEAKFVQAQLVHERIADIAMDLYVSSCVLSRLDHLMSRTQVNGKPGDPYEDASAGLYFLKMAFRRIRERF